MSVDQIEEIIELASAHGDVSEPDMEVGDLQKALRLIWQVLADHQQDVLYARIQEQVFGMDME